MDTATPASSGGTESSAPSTFAEAFAADASPASSTPESQTTPAAAAAPPAPGVTPGDDRSPFIPRERFDEVNTKYGELKAWKERHGWAETVDQTSMQSAIALAQRATADPIGYLQDFIKELQAHPTHGSQLKSLAAKALAARTQNAEPQVETIPVQLEDGRVVQFPTADSVAKREAWLRQQAVAEATQQLQPFMQTVESLRAKEQDLQRQADISRYVDTTYTDVQTWPGMQDAANRKAVGEALAQMSLEDDDPRTVALALNTAYRQVVLPTLSSNAQSQLLDSLKTKAAASTSVNPGQTATAPPPKVTSFYDKSLTWK